MKSNKTKPKDTSSPVPKEQLIKSANTFPVVGIGASAGGLDAFKKLLKAIPEDSGMAFVLVQHLDPKHQSQLPELLQKVTSIPVLEITDDIKVQPDHIYILPSNKMMVANDGVLLLTPRSTNKNERNLPVDLFFTSLAEVHQSHSIGVVLSGTASDGTKGLRAIKEQGGITFAQDEESAAYGGMPNSAVQAGVVDFILPPEQIPQKLLEIVKIINKKGTAEETTPQQNEEAFRQILVLLRLRKGTDFAYYKQTTLRRRILRRMALNKVEKPEGYLSLLRENKHEQDVLFQDFLIPVTSFFRDSKSFNYLFETVFPQLLKNNIEGAIIRIWVAGCSTGQEVYSIAMCLKEFLKEQRERIQIFATDISEPAIAKARSGIYSKSEVEGLSPQRLLEFFTKSNGNYQVNKSIRDICVFAVHNFLKDPPFGKLDLISCRNVLIYMQPYLQKKALTTFHYALNQNGFLLLGKSETISQVSELFGIAVKQDKIFCRKDAPGNYMHTASLPSEQGLADLNIRAKKDTESRAMGIGSNDFQKTADDIMLRQYTPASVVVNEAMDIVHFRGNTENYLGQSPGKPSHNLLKMAKEGLGFELRNIFHKVKKEKGLVIKENIAVKANGSFRNITIEAMPLPETIEPYYLVLFHEGVKSEIVNNKGETPKKKGSRQVSEEFSRLTSQVSHLEKELAQSREDMRSITEDQEAVNEELQSANEELLSGSEELQSLNEEMETSKEELQSTNEELTIVNQELIGLNEQVTEARKYAETIISTVREPLVVLDKNLRIKSANHAFYKTFQIHEAETEGKLMYELGNRQWDIPALRTLLDNILHEKEKFADFEVTLNFPNIGKRVMLLNGREMQTENGGKNLILLAIDDVTEKNIAESRAKASDQRFRNLVQQATYPIAILKGKEMIVQVANEAMLTLWNVEQEALGKTLSQIMPEIKGQDFEGFLSDVFQNGVTHQGVEEAIYFDRKDGSRETIYFNYVYQPYHEDDGIVTGVMVFATDVSEQVIARKKMEAQALMVQNLLMTAPGFIATLTGPDHVYQLINDQYQALFGRRKIQGKPAMVALPELEGQGFDKLLDKVYSTGEPYVGVDIPITLARDENLVPELRYFNFSCQPMYDENKNIFSILVFGYEVTEQVILKNKNLESQQLRAKELEDKVQQRTLELYVSHNSLLQKNEELEKLNMKLQSFAYVSSHDLQEPLRKIQILAGRIIENESETLSDKGKDYFHRMQDAANRMQTLIKDLLEYTHTGDSESGFEKVDLSKIIAEVINELEETVHEKKATIETIGLCNAHVNPSQFSQLMHNLIGNSLKFASPERPMRIIIKNEIVEGNQDINQKLISGKKYCHISVADNGIGFDPQYKDKIFEVFQRLHAKDKFSGTGIGLAIVKKIVDNHNGIITASGKLNEGVVFDIYIPA